MGTKEDDDIDELEDGERPDEGGKEDTSVEDDEHGSYEAEEKEDKVVVRTKRDPDRMQGESRRDYSRRKADERQAENIRKHVEPLQNTVKQLQELIARGQLNNAVNSFRGNQQAKPVDSDEEPFGPEYTKLADEQQDVLTAIRGAESEDTLNRLKRRYSTIEAKKRKIEVEKTLAATRPQQQSQPQQRDVWMETLELEFSDVMHNKQAMDWVRSRARMDQVEREAEGRPLRTIDDDRKDMAVAAEKFRIRRAKLPAPSRSNQAKLGGSSAAPSGGGSIDVELTDSQMSLATEMYPGKSPADAGRLWLRDMRKAGIIK